MTGSFFEDGSGFHISAHFTDEEQAQYALWLAARSGISLASADWPAELGTLATLGPRGMRDIRRLLKAEKDSPEAPDVPPGPAFFFGERDASAVWTIYSCDLAGNTNVIGTISGGGKLEGMNYDGNDTLWFTLGWGTGTYHCQVIAMSVSTGAFTVLAGAGGPNASNLTYSENPLGIDLSNPAGIVQGPVDGEPAATTLYFVETSEHVLKQLWQPPSLHHWSVRMGNPTTSGAATVEGMGTTSKLASPKGLVWDGNSNLIITNGLVAQLARYHEPSGIAYPLTTAGNGTSSGDGGQLSAAKFKAVDGLAAETVAPWAYNPAKNGEGRLFVTDRSANRVRVVRGDGTVEHFAGSAAETAGYTGDGGDATAATLTGPQHLAYSPGTNTLAICEGTSTNESTRIRIVNLANNTIDTLFEAGAGNKVSAVCAIQ